MISFEKVNTNKRYITQVKTFFNKGPLSLMFKK